MEYLRQELFPCSVPLCTKTSTSRLELEKHILKKHGEKNNEMWNKVVDFEFNFESDVVKYEPSDPIIKPMSNGTILPRKLKRKAEHTKMSESNQKKNKTIRKHEWLLRNKSDFTIQKIENLTKIELTEEAKLDFENLIKEGKDQEICCKLFGNIFGTTDVSYSLGCRNWICNSCPNGKFLGSKQEFEAHFQALDHGNVAFICELCPKSLKAFERLKLHLKNKHFTDAKCEICMEISGSNDKLLMHKLKTHGEGGYQCDACTKMCSSIYRLKAHIKDSHSVQSFTCSTCMKVFKTKAGCTAHEDTHSGKIFDCEFCVDKFISEVGKNRHVKLQHTMSFENLTCHECGSIFREKSRFNDHMKFHQKHQDLICEICEKLFHARKSKVLHKKTVHDKIRKFACNQCKHKTVSNGKLKRHVQKTHEHQQEVCFLCNITVKHPYHHVRSAHKDKPSAWQEFMDRKKEALKMLKSKVNLFSDDQEVLPSDQDIEC